MKLCILSYLLLSSVFWTSNARLNMLEDNFYAEPEPTPISESEAKASCLRNPDLTNQNVRVNPIAKPVFKPIAEPEPAVEVRLENGVSDPQTERIRIKKLYCDRLT